MSDNFFLAYFGHHKCATSWINDILDQVCSTLKLKFVIVHNPDMFDKDLKNFVKNNGTRFLSYTTANFKYVNELENFKGFHVIRDPRDIVVSAYFSHLYSHPTDEWPELIDHRKKLQNVSKEEGLFIEMKFREEEFRNLYTWNYFQPNILELKMEALVQHPYNTFVEIFRFLDIIDETSYHSSKKRIVFLSRDIINRMNSKHPKLFPFCYSPKNILIEELLTIIYRNRFSVKAKERKPGEEDTKSHYRKGIAGDWKNHFHPEHIAYFKENYNELLIKLRYEKDVNWNGSPRR